MTKPPILKPQPLSGFPEWLPAEKLVENRLLSIIRERFERFGFAPIETPAVERREVLAAKGVEAKEIYALSRLAAEEGEGATEMALHFDLTVPLARYVAQHHQKLTFPFRRYQIQKVWRGERPQAGRFREFYQCDIDIIGQDKLDLLADAEIPAVIHAVFTAMAIGPFLIRINNRKALQGLLRQEGVTAEASGAALRAIDALEKVGRDRVAMELQEKAGLAAPDRLLERLEGGLEALGDGASDPMLLEGLAELRQLGEHLAALGVPSTAWAVDPTIARGLDYYTGTVYETRLVDHPEVGSICSGGRYDDLAGAFTRQKLPGVGISIGLTRLLSRLFAAGILTPAESTPAKALVTVMDRAQLPACLEAAAALRQAGVPTELYTEDRKLAQQLKYADQKGFAAAVIIGEDEVAEGVVQIKALQSGEQRRVDAESLPAILREMIEAEPVGS